MIKHSRLTITVPDYMHQKLKKLVKPGEVSSFITEAIEANLFKLQRKLQESPLDRITQITDKLPRKSAGEIERAIEKGRV